MSPTPSKKDLEAMASVKVLAVVDGVTKELSLAQARSKGARTLGVKILQVTDDPNGLAKGFGLGHLVSNKKPQPPTP